MRTASIDLVLDSNHGKSMSLLPFMQWNLGSTIGNKMNAEHASIVMNSVWACSRSRCGTAEIAALEFSILETISWGDYHLQSPMGLEVSQEFQRWICWNHSKLFWADCKNPCAFWYFYVSAQVSWVTSTSWTPRFERIKYDTPFQRHAI